MRPITARTVARVAAYGRNGDSTLVHMSPSEVSILSGLGHLSGQQMTHNPVTGLPEAFNLKQVLAIAAPIAATMVGGPLAGAAVSGGLTYATTKDPKQALLSAVAAGAAGSMLNGVAGAAGDTAAQTAGTTAGQAATGATTDAAAQGATQAAASQGAGLAAANTASAAPATAMAADGGQIAMAQPTISAGAAPTVSTASPSWADLSAGQRLDAVKNTNWTANGGPIFNNNGGINGTAKVAGLSYAGLLGMNQQQQADIALKKLQAQNQGVGTGDAQAQFDYYRHMANTMPANQIPTYPGY